MYHINVHNWITNRFDRLAGPDTIFSGADERDHQ